MSFNKVILEGRLTADPELRYTASNIPCAKINIALDRYSKDKEKLTDFISCTAWNKTAEFLNQYFAKGASILVEGSLRSNTWTDKEGKKQYQTEVVIERVSFPVQNPKEPVKPRNEYMAVLDLNADDGGEIPF